MTAPDSVPDVFDLDQAVIDAGRALLAALAADPPDPEAVEAARAGLHQARAARWGADA